MTFVLYALWMVLQIIVGYNLILPIVFFVIYKILSKKEKNISINKELDFAIIVTAYEQTHTLKQAVASLQNLNYKNYLIYVVADKCDISNLNFTDERIILLRPDQELKSNTRSHFYAINRFKRNHELLTIIDSDNLVHPEYLNELNISFQKGFVAVQGVRKPKNLDSLYSCLDAVQDIYYHFYDREILFALGSSATLAGSGMAFKTKLYRSCLEHIDITGAGFDKILQIEILKQDHRIAFAKNAIVYDEKTSRPDQLVKQRARWFNTWFKYAGQGFKLMFRGLLHQNWNSFIFSLMFLRPPLFLVVLSAFILLIANFFISTFLVYYWILTFILFFSALLIALIHSNAEKKIFKSLLGIPVFIFYQMLSLLKVNKANEISIATEHYHNKTIEELKEKSIDGF